MLFSQKNNKKAKTLLQYLRLSVIIYRYRTRPQGHTSRGFSGALHPQSATVGVMLPLRGGLVRSVPFSEVLKDGSCAIGGCEPCQVGNQAALSGLADVPLRCLSEQEISMSLSKVHRFSGVWPFPEACFSSLKKNNEW